MNRTKTPLRYAVLELEGVRYAVVPEAVLLRLATQAGCTPAAQDSGPPDQASGLDPARLAARLRERRRRCGLTQAILAARAGIRVETLNRIERGRTTPDFGTIRRLLTAMESAEAGALPTRRGPRH